MPRINRVCQCNRISVQDEKHALLECPLSANVRLQYQMLPFDSMSSLMKCNKVKDLCNFVKDILKIYGWNQMCLESIDGAIFQRCLLSQQTKNFTMKAKRLPKIIFLDLKYWLYIMISKRNSFTCSMQVYIINYATPHYCKMFLIWTHICILLCIFIVSIKIITTTIKNKSS